MKINYEEVAEKIVEALGGKANITSLMTCATRIRIDLEDIDLLEEKKIKKLGAHYVLKLGGGAIQVIWGPTANIMEEAIKDFMKQ